MGRPSDKLRSAQRPGQRQRARVKKHRRTIVYASVPGAGTSVRIKYGQKKARRVFAWLDFAHQMGNQSRKPGHKSGTAGL